ncbi:hypothetical protein F5Y11DRAFT_229372 [Daldinia sp. FL1419]|nr:hypothetical protein F5Y11DRAFT_229372 [Daldinia sp. FL1419]
MTLLDLRSKPTEIVRYLRKEQQHLFYVQKSIASMPVQNTNTRYLKEENLLRLLRRLFPGQADFNIRVSGGRIEQGS